MLQGLARCAPGNAGFEFSGDPGRDIVSRSDNQGRACAAERGDHQQTRFCARVLDAGCTQTVRSLADQRVKRQCRQAFASIAASLRA
jgi:hypothetical protein